jgi:hypothetical protein
MNSSRRVKIKIIIYRIMSYMCSEKTFRKIDIKKKHKNYKREA